MVVRLSDIRAESGKKCTKLFRELAILKNSHFEKSAILNFFRQKKFFFCFILTKISPNLYGRLDGSKFWCFPWFPANSLLCKIKRYLYSVSFYSKFLKKLTIIWENWKILGTYLVRSNCQCKLFIDFMKSFAV